MKTNFITPVQKRGDYWFKREDLYVPYSFSPANGSKLRQCQLLVEKNIKTATNGIVTGTSINSPQAIIAASVAHEKGIPCTVFYGGTTNELLNKKKYPVLAKSLGADISVVSKMAFTSVLNARAEKFAKENNKYNIRYGFDLSSNLDVFVESVANQVQNIPNEIKNIVITVGSAITIIGLLYGLSLYPNNVERIYAIGCAPNRMKKIQDYSDMLYFERSAILPINKMVYIDAFDKYKGFKYESTMNEEYFDIFFHPRYEAKTFNWLRNNPLSDCMMWITGSDFNL